MEGGAEGAVVVVIKRGFAEDGHGVVGEGGGEDRVDGLEEA